MNFRTNGGLLSLLAFIAAVFFFLLAALTVDLAGIALIPAGLTSLASAFLLQRFGL
jgi:hypothetical protein